MVNNGDRESKGKEMRGTRKRKRRCTGGKKYGREEEETGKS